MYRKTSGYQQRKAQRPESPFAHCQSHGSWNGFFSPFLWSNWFMSFLKQLEVAGRAITVQICTNDLLSLQQFMNIFGWSSCICSWSCHSLMCLIFLVFHFPSSHEASHGFLHQNYPCHAEGAGISVRGSFPKVGGAQWLAITGTVESSRTKRKKQRCAGNWWHKS